MLGTYTRRMARTAVLLAAGAVMTAYAVPSAEVQVHHVSLRVVDEGKEVMTPAVQMTADGPVQLSVGSSGNAYTLVLDILDEADSGIIDKNAAMQVVLWKGSADSGKRMLDQVIILTPGSSSNLKNAATSVELVSHAIELKPGDSLQSQRECVPKDGHEVAASGPGIAAQTCCGRLCGDHNDADATLTCCGPRGTKCCGCGVCCGIP